jgi:hypothetical protein
MILKVFWGAILKSSNGLENSSKIVYYQWKNQWFGWWDEEVLGNNREPMVQDAINGSHDFRNHPYFWGKWRCPKMEDPQVTMGCKT